MQGGGPQLGSSWKGPYLSLVWCLGTLAKQVLAHTNCNSAIFLELSKLAHLPHLPGGMGPG